MARAAWCYLAIQLIAVCSAVAANVNGVVQSREGIPLGNAVVALHEAESTAQWYARIASGNPTRPAIRTTHTGIDGKFALETSGKVVVDVAVSLAGYGPVTARLAAGEDAGVIQLAEAPNVRGRVVCGTTPAERANVILTGTGEFVTTTDHDGYYAIPRPNGWAKRLLITHEGCAVLDEPLQTEGAFTLDRTLVGGLALSGAAVDERGVPVASALVFIDRWPAGTTAADGTFQVPHASQSWRTLTVVADRRQGRRLRSQPASEPVRLQAASSVSGIAKDALTRTPLEGAEVQISVSGSPEDSDVTLTDPDGQFLFIGLFSGSYTLWLKRPGFEPVSDSITVSRGGRARKHLYAPRAASISGWIKTEKGTPVLGARITVLSGEHEVPTSNTFAPGRACFSDDNGRFVIGTVRTGVPIHLLGVKQQLPRARSEVFSLRHDEARAGILLTVPVGVSLRGRVRDERRLPLEMVSVSVREPQTNPLTREPVISEQTVMTSKAGAFVATIAPGRYDLVFSKHGFVTTRLSAVSLDVQMNPLDIVLQRGAVIAGRVERDHKPVSDARVSVIAKDGEVSTSTGADGSFALPDLAPGKVTLVASRAEERTRGYAVVAAPASDVVVVLPAETRLRGRVFDAATKNSVTAFQLGVSTLTGGGDVRIASLPELRDVFDLDGRFEVNVPVGRATVVVNAAGYALARTAPLVIDGSEVPEVEVPLWRGVTLSGRIAGDDASPLAGANVRRDVSLEAGVMPLPRELVTRTNADGEYSLESLPEGESTFLVTAPGYLAQKQTIALRAPETRLDVTLKPGMRITGSVRLQTGEPIPGAVITARAMRSPSAPHNGITDTSGAFVIDGLAPGQYGIRVTKDGYSDAAVNDVDTATTPNLDIVLRAGGSIIGHVLCVSSEDGRRIVVHATSSTGQTLSHAADASGTIRMEHVSPGTATVWSTVSNGSDLRTSQVRTVPVEEGREVSVELEFSDGYTVQGHITRNGSPLGDASVEFRSVRDTIRAVRTQSNADGEYTVSSLDKGAHLILITDVRRGTTFRLLYDVTGSSTYDVIIETGSLRGEVTTTENAALPEASLVITDAAGTSIRTTTGPDGRFFINDLRAGSYVVEGRKPNFEVQAAAVEVRANGESKITLRLNRTDGN